MQATGSNTYGQLGDTTTRSRLTVVTVGTLTGVTKIASSFDFSSAIKSDGTLWMWGYNIYGQSGNGTWSLTAPTPAAVPGLTNIAAVATGRNHAVVVTAGGVVSAWGDGYGGKLGDGLSQSTLSPVVISEANHAWKVSTPVFSVPAGTYNAVQVVTVTAATPGSVVHYTVSGAEPAESDPTIASGATIQVAESLTLKARAWTSGMPASSIASAAYVLAAQPVSITPTLGTFDSPQTVSMATPTAGATIRYTTDGSAPTLASVAYACPFSIGTSMTIKAAAFRTGWASSGTSSAVLTMNVENLEIP
jgi:alpha-tubulin suppressor-like RCC1 family protein